MKALVQQLVATVALVGQALVAVADMPTRATAIEVARNGDFDASLEMFAALRQADPDDTELLANETVVLAWAGNDKAVVANGASLDPASAPDYAVAAVAKAHRNLRAFEKAADWYLALLQRDENDFDSRRGLAMSLADAGRIDEARASLSTAPRNPDDESLLALTEAYVYERAGRYMEALGRYQRALELDPNNRDALRGKALVLRSSLLPQQALAIARAYPGLLSEEEIEQLEADEAALRLRYGIQATYRPENRFRGIDLGLAEIDRMLADPSLEPRVRERLEFDRIVALNARLQMAEAIAAFEALPMPQDAMPSYVLSAAGGAYLYERQPDEARVLLEAAVAREPDNIEFRFHLFFVYADLQEHDKAREIASGLLAELPPTQRAAGSNVVKGSDAYLRAAILNGLAAAYSDQLADSQSYFEGMLEDLPNNTEIRRELANVYHWRGWIDLSLAEYGRVLAVEPELVSARVGQAHTQFDNRDFAVVEQELQWLVEEHKHEASVRKLQERWQVHNRSELSIDARIGESSGTTFGQDQYTIDAIWLSQPIGHHFRAYINTHDAYAEFPEGNIHRRRIGAGTEYRYRRWYGRAGLSAPRDGNGGVGLRAFGEYRLSDTLRLGGSIETESNATPLRGERVGVSSNLIGTSVSYARNELTSLRGDLSYQDLSDGNDVTIMAVAGDHRVVNHPRYKLTVLGNLATEHRAKSDVAYFSPERALGGSVGLRAEMRIYRRYDIGFDQSLTGRLGFYDQQGFSAGNTWSLDYLLSAGFTPRWHGYVGFSRSSHPYDGAQEYATFFLAGFGGRF